jgi:hypothetical protein
MGGSNFDQIAQALLKQQQIMRDLQAQNDQLRQQLLDLRSGRGIFVLINGTRIPLVDITSSQNDTPANDETTSVAPTTPVISSEPEEQPTMMVMTPPAETMPTDTDIASPSQEEATPQPASEPVSSVAMVDSSTTQEDADQPSFLEDLMIGEFASAMTSPLHVPNSPSVSSTEAESSTPSDTDEAAKQQADLKRALIGSYVLD